MDTEAEQSVGSAEQPNQDSYLSFHSAQMFTDGWSFSGFERNKVFLGRGDGSFADLSDVSGADTPNDSRGAVWADFDDDGDADVFVHNLQRERHDLYRNDIATGHWIAVRVRGETSTTRGVGARVRVRTAPDAAWQVRPVVADTRLMGQGPTQLHFGLADHAGPVQVEVSFPASGLIRTIEDAPADAMVTVFEASPPE